MKKIIIVSVLLAFFTSIGLHSFAHCDSRNGPVVKAAREALKTNNVNLVLIWVQDKFESEVKNAFGKTLAVRKISAEAQALADEYFFETVVRLHRLGEGESYTGIKDEEPEPSVLSAERALEQRSADSILIDLSALMQQGLDKHLVAGMQSAYYNPNDLKAGREHIDRYIQFIRYVEGLYRAASSETTAHSSLEDRQSLLTTGIVSDSDINQTGWTDNLFDLLVLSVLILMALLMVIILLFGKNRKPKIQRHDPHNGMAQHLA